MSLFTRAQLSTSQRPNPNRPRLFVGLVTALVLAASGIAIGALSASAAAPTGTLDQSNSVANGGFYDFDPGNDWIQTFTAGISGTLSGVEVREAEGASSVAGTVQIVAVNQSTGVPTLSALASTAIAATSTGGWVTVDFSAPPQIFAGSQYGILIGGSSGRIAIDSSVGQAYAGGSIYSDSGSIRAGGEPADDLDFMTYVDTSSNAAPALPSAPASSIVVNQPYSFAYGASGFPTPVLSVSSGSLPPGLTLSSAGVLSGTPTSTGSYPFTVEAYNGVEPSAQATSTIVVRVQTPGAPTIGTATPGNQQATVAFTAPADHGDTAIMSYLVVSSPGGFTGIGTTSPITVTGLTNGTAYTFTVTATNSFGTGPASAASNSATPRTVPGAPSGLSAVPESHSIQLSWTAPSNGGADISSYEVQVSTDNATWHDATSSTLTSVTLMGLTNGTKYYYRVAAKNDAGESIWSDSVNATPRTVPGAPTALAASVRSETVSLAWTAPTDNGGAEVLSYTVRYSTDGTTWHDGGSVGSSPDAITGLTNGIAYQFEVAAVNVAGTGPWSGAVSATPITTPDTPDGLTATPGNGKADLVWNAPFDGGSDLFPYDVEYRVAGGLWVGGGSSSGTSYSVTGLDNGTAYEFQVRAVNAAGASGWSSIASATPRTVPDAPAWSTIIPSDGEIQLTWSAPASGGSDITGYLLQDSTNGVDWFDLPSGTATSADLTSLVDGTAYSFRVRATNAAGSGAFSSVTTATPRTLAGAPVWSRITPGDSTVSLSWAAPASNGGATIDNYDVQLSTDGSHWTDAGSPTTSLLAVSALDNGTTYDFRVRADNAAGDGPWSATATSVPRTVPDAPTDATVIPADGSINLSWATPASDGGAPVDWYETQIRAQGTTAWSDGPTVTSATTDFTGLSDGTAYDLRARAVNIAGPGAWSDIVSTTPFDFEPTFTLSAGGNLDGTSVTPGTQVTITASDLPVGSVLTVELHSTPIVLGTTTVGASGALHFVVTMPAGVEAGSHQLVATLTGTGTSPASVVANFTLSAATPSLASTGLTLPWLAAGAGVLALLIGTLLIWRRRNTKFA